VADFDRLLIDPTAAGTPTKRSCARAPAGRSAATDEAVCVWDLDRPGSPAAAVEWQAAGYFSAAMTADGRLLLTGGTDGSVHLWPLGTLLEA
jgi:WD40 repeat protein